MFVPPGKPQTLPLFCHHLCLSTNASDTQYTSRQHLRIRYLVPSTLKSKSELYVPEHPLLSHLSMTAITFPLTVANPFPPTHNNSECCYKDLDLSLLTSICFFPFKSSTACLYCQESASLDFQICLLSSQIGLFFTWQELAPCAEPLHFILSTLSPEYSSAGVSLEINTTKIVKCLTTGKKSNTIFCTSYLKNSFWKLLNTFQCNTMLVNSTFIMISLTRGLVFELFFPVLQTLYLQSR